MTNTRVIDLTKAWSHVPYAAQDFGVFFPRWKAEWTNRNGEYNSRVFWTRNAARKYLNNYRKNS